MAKAYWVSVYRSINDEGENSRLMPSLQARR